jgi:hypothetical protein
MGERLNEENAKREIKSKNSAVKKYAKRYFLYLAQETRLVQSQSQLPKTTFSPERSWSS